MLLTKEEELNDFEKEVVEAQKEAIKSLKEFKESKKERYYGVFNPEEKGIKLSEEEQKAWWKSKFALGKAIEYLTNKGKIPLDVERYNDLYYFVKNFYHPEFAENWGHRFERSYHLDFKFSITPEVEKIMIQEDMKYKQKIFKELYKRDLEKQGYSPNEIEEKMKQINISSIEFRTDKVSPESAEKILKKWIEEQKKKDEMIKRIKEMFDIE